MLRASRTAALSALVLCTLAGSAGQVLAAQPAATPAAAPAVSEDTALPVIVLAVQGAAGYSEDGKPPFKPLKPGTVLKMGNVIQTGANGGAILQVGSAQQITVTRLTRLTLAEIVNAQGVERSRLKLNSGKVVLEVTSTGVKNDVTVTTPDAVAAVTGTGLIVQYGSGFGTYSENLHGAHALAFRANNVIATLFRGDSSDSSDRDPASKEKKDLYLETNDKRSYDGDEQGFVQDFIIFGPIVNDTFTETEGSFLIQDDATYVAMNSPGSLLEQTDIFGLTSNKRDGLKGFTGEPIAGTPFYVEALQRLVFLALEVTHDEKSDTTTPIIRIFDPKSNTQQFELLAEYPPGGIFGNVVYDFGGIAAVGDSLYAQGHVSFEDLPGQIFGLEIEGITGSPKIITERGTKGGPQVALPVQLMTTGINFQRGLAGNNVTGGVFVTGSLPGRSFGLGNGRQFIIVEVDPRTNYVNRAFSNEHGDFSTDGTQFLNSGIKVSDLTNVTGLAMAGNALIITGTTSKGQTLVLQYNPAAAGTSADPFVRKIRLDAKQLFAANSYDPRVVGSPVSLGEPTHNIESEYVNQTWAAMGYSAQAVQSGVVEQMVRQQVLSYARDPQGCVSSGQLAQLGSIISQHTGQSSGFGQVMSQFRENVSKIDPDHPCLPGYNKGGGKGA